MKKTGKGNYELLLPSYLNKWTENGYTNRRKWLKKKEWKQKWKKR
jgi:hypothetical protein